MLTGRLVIDSQASFSLAERARWWTVDRGQGLNSWRGRVATALQGLVALCPGGKIGARMQIHTPHAKPAHPWRSCQWSKEGFCRVV